MNKTLKKIIAYVCLIALCLALSGCSQFMDLGGDDGEVSGYEQVSVTVQLNKQKIFCDTKQTFQGQPINVSFEEDESAEYLSPTQAAQKVMRSVVAINMTNANSVVNGSGVIVDIKGGLNANEYYVMTCHHVIASGGLIIIYVPDAKARNVGDADYDQNYMFTGYIGSGKDVDAQNSVCLVGGDRDGDIAILKLKVGNRLDENSNPIVIEKATCPNENTLSIGYGEEVFAIGNPAGDLPMTYLHGYISYLDRTASFESVGIMTNLIQHDCVITHGSSGGGLFNMKGQLIGITNGGISTNAGLSYAIPYYTYTGTSDYGFMYIAKQLIKTNNDLNYGYVEGRWELGVGIDQAKNRVGGSVVMVSSVEENSNAYGKLAKGDYITKIEFLDKEYTITTKESFQMAIFNARERLLASPYSEIKFTIQRAN